MKIEVSKPELAEIAWALDEMIMSLEQTEDEEAIDNARGLRVLRKRIAPIAKYQGCAECWS